ncbi:MAG: hypothetical protein HYS38_00710 [Acidobacteria bacterium]|nr:hypothetical protein [Acidobacteriota bacterium]
MFENIPPIDPRAERRRRRLIVGAVFTVICAAYFYYELKNYPEERQLRRFFEALEQQDYQRAYQLWQPTSAYTFKNFLEDWGPNGVQGTLRQFRIKDSQAEGTGVNILAIINEKEPVLLWVEQKDKSLSFSPLEPEVSILSLLLPSSLADLWLERSRRRMVVTLILALLLAGYLYYEFKKSAGES